MGGKGEYKIDPFGIIRIPNPFEQGHKRGRDAPDVPMAQEVRKLAKTATSVIRSLSGISNENKNSFEPISSTRSGTVEEVWIGPKGFRSRKKRRFAERDQTRLLEEALAFGTAGNNPGPGYYNVPERIQRYIWDQSSTFSCGWGDDNKQGECNYSIQAPYWPYLSRFYRFALKNDVTNPEFKNSILYRTGFWEGSARWTISNDSSEHAELTVWRLYAKDDTILTSEIVEVKDVSDHAWFPAVQPVDEEAGEYHIYENGLFHYKTDNLGAYPGSVVANSPVFDQQQQTAGSNNNPTEVDYKLPVCMQRSFNNRVVGSQSLEALAQQPTAHYYFNSPMDYPALTENFKIVPAYRRWFGPGDKAILKAALPNPFQTGYEKTLKTGDIGGPPTYAAQQPEPDEQIWAWRAKYGPLYLFRIRGMNVYSSTEEVLEGKAYIPHQGINYGSAILNINAHYEHYVNLLPYPEEEYIYRQAANMSAQLNDQFPFLSEAHSQINTPQTFTGAIPPTPPT